METVKHVRAGDLPWVASTKNDRGLAMSVIRPLMDIPAAMEVWYEPGFVKEVHQHPMDEIFYILKGSMMMHGREFTPGSALFVPGKTLYGPEYASDEGTFFLRVELWDSGDGRPGGQVGQVRPGNGKFTAYEGPVTSEGLPNTGGATAAPPVSERMLDPVEGSFGPLADEVEWEEISLPGETHDLKMSVKRLLLPNPDVEEVRRGPGNPIPARTDDVDRLWYVIDGEMTMNGHRMTRGSTLFVRKGEPYDCSGTGPEGVRYLRVKLMDEKGMDARLG